MTDYNAVPSDLALTIVKYVSVRLGLSLVSVFCYVMRIKPDYCWWPQLKPCEMMFMLEPRG